MKKDKTKPVRVVAEYDPDYDVVQITETYTGGWGNIRYFGYWSGMWQVFKYGFRGIVVEMYWGNERV